MEVYKGKYIHILNPEPKFAFYTWQATTEDMEEEEYHEQNAIILQHTKELDINKHLLDARKFLFSITPEIQEQVAANFFAEIIKLGEQKVAFLVPEDIFSQVSLEQVMLEEQTGTLRTRYFDTEESAKEWLFA